LSENWHISCINASNAKIIGLTHYQDCASIMVKVEKNEISFAKQAAQAGDIP
jgi:hypothetical protein